MAEIFLKDVSYKIIGTCFEVHNCQFLAKAPLRQKGLCFRRSVIRFLSSS